MNDLTTFKILASENIDWPAVNDKIAVSNVYDGNNIYEASGSDVKNHITANAQDLGINLGAFSDIHARYGLFTDLANVEIAR